MKETLGPLLMLHVPLAQSVKVQTECFGLVRFKISPHKFLLDKTVQTGNSLKKFTSARIFQTSNCQSVEMEYLHMFNTLPLGGYKSFSCILLIQFQFTFMFFVNTSFGFQQHLNIAKGDASVSLHNNYCLRQQHCGLAVRNCIICEPFLFCYSEFVKKIRLNLLQGTEKK